MRKVIIVFFLIFTFLLVGCEKEKTVKVNFDVNGGNELSALTIKSDEDLKLPNPTKVGFTFLGWFMDEALEKELDNKAIFKKKAVTLYAKWKTGVYNISFVGGGDITPIYLVYNSDIPNLPKPYKDGDVFMGWYTDEKFMDKFNLTKMPGHDLVLYAKWQDFNELVDKVMVYFNTVGGEELDAIIIQSSDDIILPFPDKTGHIFLGWYLDENYDTYIDYNYIFTQEEVTLYAKWMVITYMVSFKNEDDKLAPIHFDYGETLELPAPFKLDDTFMGWYLDEGLTEELTLTKMPDYNLILYAKWYSSDYEDEIPVDSPLTDLTYPMGAYEGNTNGNLNNFGLAVYCYDKDLHYYVSKSSIYSYDPSENKTNLVYTIEHGGRPIYLNVYDEDLYFINSYNGYLLKYNTKTNEINVIIEDEHTYLYVSNYYIYALVKKVILEENRGVFRSIRLSNIETIKDGLRHLENVNIMGTRVYYLDLDNFSLSVMADTGQGRTTILYLTDKNITDVFEIILYNRAVIGDGEYFAFVLKKSSITGFYVFDTSDKESLEKVIEGPIHSLNYDEHFVYYILENKIYRYNMKSGAVSLLYEANKEIKNLQIINYWFYYSDDDNNLYRINPVTKTSELLD